MRRISITGPESSGKTSLTKALAAHYNCPHTVEFSREYLTLKNGSYDLPDLTDILKGQLELEKKAGKIESPFLFCDSDPLVIWIWSKVKFDTVDPFIDLSWKEHLYDLYILVYPDAPWEYDPLRENEHGRHELFSLYEEKLVLEKRPFIVVKGSEENRLEKAIDSLNKLV